jgi:hypothetical protein
MAIRRVAAACVLALLCGCDAGASSEDEDPIVDYALGLRWDDIFVQSIWAGGEPAYLLANIRNEPVTLDFFGFPCGKSYCSKGKRLASVELAADSVTALSGAKLEPLLAADTWLAVQANGVDLGLLGKPSVPTNPTARTVVYPDGLNVGGGHAPGPHEPVEAPFLTPPGPEFTLTVPAASLSDGEHDSWLDLHSKNEPVGSLTFLDVIAVRSDVAAVTATADGFSVTIPPTSAGSVDIDVAVPEGFAGDFIGFSASYCAWSCTVSGGSLARGIPLVPVVGAADLPELGDADP